MIHALVSSFWIRALIALENFAWFEPKNVADLLFVFYIKSWRVGCCQDACIHILVDSILDSHFYFVFAVVIHFVFLYMLSGLIAWCWCGECRVL